MNYALYRLILCYVNFTTVKKKKKWDFSHHQCWQSRTNYLLFVYWLYSWLSFCLNSYMELWHLKDFVWHPLIFAPSFPLICTFCWVGRNCHLYAYSFYWLNSYSHFNRYNLGFTCAIPGIVLMTVSLFDEYLKLS